MGKRPRARGGQETKAAAAPPASEQTRQLPAAGVGSGEQPPWARGSRKIGGRYHDCHPLCRDRPGCRRGQRFWELGDSQGEAAERHACPAGVCSLMARLY